MDCSRSWRRKNVVGQIVVIQVMRYVRVDSTHGAPCWADMLGKTAWLLSKAGNDVFASWALLVGLMLRQAATHENLAWLLQTVGVFAR